MHLNGSVYFKAQSSSEWSFWFWILCGTSCSRLHCVGVYDKYCLHKDAYCLCCGFVNVMSSNLNIKFTRNYHLPCFPLFSSHWSNNSSSLSSSSKRLLRLASDCWASSKASTPVSGSLEVSSSRSKKNFLGRKKNYMKSSCKMSSQNILLTRL